MATARRRQEERDSRNLDARLDQKSQINLTTSGIDATHAIIDVSDQARVSIVLTEAIAASWTTGEITLKRSLDRENWYDLDPTKTADAPAEFWDLNVEDANYIAIDVTTVASLSTRVLWSAKTYSPNSGGEVSTDPNDPLVVTQSLQLPRGTIKFGRNDALGTSTETFWSVGGNYTGFLSAATTLSVVSTDANDTAAGSGCQTVTITGLDANWDVQVEEVTMNGLTPVVTSTTWIRVYRVFAQDNGTYLGANVGVVDASSTGAGTPLMARMELGAGQTQMAVFSVPRNTRAYIKAFALRANTNQSITARICLQPRPDIVSTPFHSSRVYIEAADFEGAAQGTMYVSQPGIGPFDIFVQGEASSGTAKVSATFQVQLEEAI